MSKTVIYHNPRCSTSRNALEILREGGVEPEIVHYMEAGWTARQLRNLAERAGTSVRAFLRTKEPLAEELGLKGEDVSEERLIEAMVEHPILVERPIVASDKGVVLARPVERARDVI